jgi:sugar-specific transcriptional regulator TrmB
MKEKALKAARKLTDYFLHNNIDVQHGNLYIAIMDILLKTMEEAESEHIVTHEEFKKLGEQAKCQEREALEREHNYWEMALKSQDVVNDFTKPPKPCSETQSAIKKIQEETEKKLSAAWEGILDAAKIANAAVTTENLADSYNTLAKLAEDDASQYRTCYNTHCEHQEDGLCNWSAYQYCHGKKT